MPRLLLNATWYEPLRPNAMSDASFEQLLLGDAGRLFPDFQSLSFRVRIESEHGSASPQLALVDSDYRSWWLCFLETGVPPTAADVLKRAEIVRTARYGAEVGEAMVARLPDLD